MPAKESTAKTIHPAFREFVNPDIRSLDVGSPFWLDGFLYASDGSIIVRRAVNEAEIKSIRVVSRKGRFPDLKLIFGGFKAADYSDDHAIPDGIEAMQWFEAGALRRRLRNRTSIVFRRGKHHVKFQSYYLSRLRTFGAENLHFRPGRKGVGHQAYFATAHFDGFLMPMK